MQKASHNYFLSDNLIFFILLYNFKIKLMFCYIYFIYLIIRFNMFDKNKMIQNNISICYNDIKNIIDGMKWHKSLK